MIVLGIDPGSHATGFGVIDTGPVCRLREAGVVRTAAADPLPDRLAVIHARIGEVVRAHRPEVMVVEDLFNARNPRSSLILGHARGVVLLAGAEAGLRVVEYAPREIKKALTGNGAAAKEQVRFMVMRLLGLKEEPPLDQSDALAAALAFAGRSGGRVPG